MKQDLLRKIPKTDILLARPEFADGEQSGLKRQIQEYQQKLRNGILDGSVTELPDIDQMVQDILGNGHDVFHLRRVINATGVVLHTNLGRSPLGPEAAQHMAQIAQGYCNLEYDLEAGKRGSRYSHVESLLCELTGAEAAMVVNNNAGAVFLMLNTLAKGKNVAISRGELVEIGGSFRVPEIMEQSGAHLVEVGTTNKTHPEDYADAISQKDASVLLKVHTSNFTIQGFTESVSVAQMAQIAQDTGAMVLYDVGSCFLFNREELGLHEGENVSRLLKDGADVVCLSGDKLMGSAQGGILLGKKEYIERMKKNHLTRMLRIDKLSLAALEMALRHCLDPREAVREIPVLRMLSMTRDQCEEKALQLAERLMKAAPSMKFTPVFTEDEVGGGSLPGVMLPGCAVGVIAHAAEAQTLEAFLRSRRVPVITRVQREQLLLSPRTLCPGDDQELETAFAELDKKLTEERKVK